MRHFFGFIVLQILLMTFGVGPLLGADFDVNTTTDTQDSNPGDGICADSNGDCSLRAAIMEANSLSGDDTVSLPSGTYTLTLEGMEDYASVNDLDAIPAHTLTVIGSGNGGEVIIDSTPLNDRSFEIHDGATLILKNLTITGGLPDYGPVEGGGIRVAAGGILNLDHVIITENQALYGGGIYNAGTLTGEFVSVISNSMMTGASGYGGGIFLAWTTNNSVNLKRSLVADNRADYGAGIYNGGNGSYYSPVGGNLRLENVTVSDNTAVESGGGIQFQQGSSAYLVNCTVVNNVNSSYSSGAGMMGNGAPALDFLNTLVANNRNNIGLDNCYQIPESTSQTQSGLNNAYFDQNVPFGHNMSDGDCFTPVADVMMEASLTTSDALAGVGTYALQEGSPAIDAGDWEDFPVLDVFGTSRPQGDAPDIGAYEFEADPNEAPNTPVLTSPASGHTFLSGGLIKLFWEKCTDPEGGKVNYRLEIAKDSGFTSGRQNHMIDEDGNEILIGSLGLGFPLLAWVGWGGLKRRRRTQMLLVAGLVFLAFFMNGCGNSSNSFGENQDENVVAFEVSALDSGTTYYWRVIAVDEQGKESEPSEPRSFSTP
ncbi:MAG: CSLREA domain-containing protein [Desulfobacteraceae bacterium]|nr:CSLREA domain-containing protein [Desulfobacteraceae bacterium]MBU4053855.1 CSLREA domain-containing protein [Pseudomonadota bacterium]